MIYLLVVFSSQLPISAIGLVSSNLGSAYCHNKLGFHLIALWYLPYWWKNTISMHVKLLSLVFFFLSKIQLKKWEQIVFAFLTGFLVMNCVKMRFKTVFFARLFVMFREKLVHPLSWVSLFMLPSLESFVHNVRGTQPPLCSCGAALQAIKR